MAINEQPIEFEYVADGNTTTFPFTCRVIYEMDLIVQVNGIQVFNFTINGLDNPAGGNVIFDKAPLKDSIVLIAREVKLIRETEYQQNGDFLAPTVNKDFDRLWMALQAAQGWYNRALKYPLGGTNYNAEDRRIEGTEDPLEKQDVATKNYVDIGDARLEDIVNELSGNIIQGWIIVESFKKGATLTLKNQILLNEVEGRYYRWLGSFPKLVPTNSTPEKTGGFGEKAWALVTIDDTQYLPLGGGSLSGKLSIIANPPAVCFRYRNGELLSENGYCWTQDNENFILKKIQNDETEENVFQYNADRSCIEASKIVAKGTLCSEHDQNSDLCLLTQTGDKNGYFIRRSEGDLFIYNAENGEATDIIAQYSKSNNAWDFNIRLVTVNKRPVMVDNKVLGINQRWYDVTDKRNPGTIYTNETGQPIMWCLSCKETGGWDTKFFIDNVQVGQASWANVQLGLSFIVPNGSKYYIDHLENYPNNTIWAELRINNV